MFCVITARRAISPFPFLPPGIHCSSLLGSYWAHDPTLMGQTKLNAIGSWWKLDPKLPPTRPKIPLGSAASGPIIVGSWSAWPKIPLGPADSRTYLSCVLLEVDPSILGPAATRTLQCWALPTTGPISIGSTWGSTISDGRTHQHWVLPPTGPNSVGSY
jgi:hypothetical protein